MQYVGLQCCTIDALFAFSDTCVVIMYVLMDLRNVPAGRTREYWMAIGAHRPVFCKKVCGLVNVINDLVLLSFIEGISGSP